MTQRLGIKYRSLRLGVGWAMWLLAFPMMGRVYYFLPAGRWNSGLDSQEHILKNSPHLLAREILGSLPQTEPRASYLSAHNRANPIALYELGQRALDRKHYHDSLKLFRHFLVANTTVIPGRLLAKSLYGMARSYIAVGELGSAREWTDRFYRDISPPQAEPAYHLCRALREDGQNDAAFYYYLLATRSPPPPSPDEGYLPVEPEIHDYLLDYEKSILWSYVGDIGDLYSRLHGLSFSMRTLDNPRLPHYIRDSVFNNLQFYTPHLEGRMEVLRAEKSTEDEWRYSSPTFVSGQALIRVVNYYVSEDGSYHVSKGDKVMTRLITAATEEVFEVKAPEAAVQDGLHHPDAYVLGLEDTRAVVDASRNHTIFTLSASQEYSLKANVMGQVLGTLSMADHTHTIQAVLEGPYPDRHDKNWVFAGGLDHVVYGWHPSIEIGRINLEEEARLQIHTSIQSPPSFFGMRGSTNGVLYRDEWWFVTHAVIYRPGQMRKYLHRLVVFDQSLSAIVRHSLPFTFEPGSDVEYCLGLEVDDAGLTFGYSVRDRSSRVLSVEWSKVGHLFTP